MSPQIPQTKFVSRDGHIQVYVGGKHVGHIAGYKDNYRLRLLNNRSVGLWTYCDDARRAIRVNTAKILEVAALPPEQAAA